MEPAKHGMSVRRVLGGLGVTAMVGGAAAAAWLWVSTGASQTTDNAYLRADATIIAPRIDGYVAEVRVRENQSVDKGDVLVRMADGKYRAQVAQAIAARQAREAQVEGDRAALNAIDAQRLLPPSMIEQAVANQAAAAAEADRARLDYERYQSLTAPNAATTQRLEAATSTHLKADAERRRAAAQIAADQQRLLVLEADHRKGEARLAQSIAELAEADALAALARTDYDDTRLTAPYGGVVGNLAARVGQYVRPGTALMTLVSRKIYVVANFKETQVTRMRPGQKAVVTVDAFPDWRFEALVESFSPATGSEFSLLPPENATGNFTKIVQRVPVRLRVIDPDGRAQHLASGLSVTVTVDTASPGCDAECGPSLSAATASGAKASPARDDERRPPPL